MPGDDGLLVPAYFMMTSKGCAFILVLRADGNRREFYYVLVWGGTRVFMRGGTIDVCEGGTFVYCISTK